MNITEINVNENKVNVLKVGDVNYISLTDLARYVDEEEPKIPIQNWMRNKDVILYLGLWEKINSDKFKGIEFDIFKNEAGSNKFRISPQRWIKETNAIGIVFKYVNQDILSNDEERLIKRGLDFKSLYSNLYPKKSLRADREDFSSIGLK